MPLILTYVKNRPSCLLDQRHPGTGGYTIYYMLWLWLSVQVHRDQFPALLCGGSRRGFEQGGGGRLDVAAAHIYIYTYIYT